MKKQQQMIGVLEQLRLMRERAANQLSGQLAQQKQLAQRYLNNVEALNRLGSVALPDNSGGAQMHNLANYKATIQRVVDWQKQEHALANVQAAQMQQALRKKACEEMSVAHVMQQQQQALNQTRERQQQKQTDAQAMQCWLRQQRKPRGSL